MTKLGYFSCPCTKNNDMKLTKTFTHKKSVPKKMSYIIIVTLKCWDQ